MPKSRYALRVFKTRTPIYFEWEDKSVDAVLVSTPWGAYRTRNWINLLAAFIPLNIKLNRQPLYKNQSRHKIYFAFQQLVGLN